MRVPLISRQSVNAYRYTEECLRKAIPLFEGAKVVDGLMSKIGGPVQVTSILGKVKNVQEDASGLTAEVDWFPGRDCGELLVDGLFKLASYAFGDIRDGKVLEIWDVRGLWMVPGKPAQWATADEPVIVGG